jgi:hypothetical protein
MAAHLVVVGERHLRHVLASYQKYYNEVRTHLSLQKDAGSARCVPDRARAFVANLGRATPSICSSLSFRRGQGQSSALGAAGMTFCKRPHRA